MAEVDARTMRGAVAAPVTAIASERLNAGLLNAGKLNSLAADHRLIATDGGLFDAFAEVFASMSRASVAADSSKSPWSLSNSEQRFGQGGRANDKPGDSSGSTQEPQATVLPHCKNSDEEDNESTVLAASIAASNTISEQTDASADPGGELQLQSDGQTRQQAQRDDSLGHGQRRAQSESARGTFTSDGAGAQNGGVKHDSDNQTLVRGDTAASAGAEGAATLGQPVDPSAIQSDPNDAESHDVRRRQRRQRSGPEFNLSEANPGDVRKSDSAQRVASHPISSTSSIAAELVAVPPEGDEAAATTIPSNPTLQPTTTSGQLPDLAAALRGADGGHGSPATAKGMSASADIHGASQWASRPAARTVRSDGSTSDVVARIKLIQRVSKAFQHLGPDGGSIRIRLAPAELGSVRVEMHVHHRQVRARVVADSEATSSVLREHLPDLRARLESYGLQVERLEVETETADHGLDARQNSDSHWQPPQQQRRSAGSFTTSAPPSLRAEAAVTSVAADSAADILRSASRGVDVRL